ncbi:MAG TPA: efflux RND transporter periplasmic adaptor subunit [Burkholderiales bacterium]|nr:efflux RND transporter periplasmic adaptor subunit [Burkholderiales bacterium]
MRNIFAGKRRLTWLAGAAVALAAAGAVLAVSIGDSSPQAPGPAQAVLEFAAGDIVTAETRELARSVPLTGTLKPFAEAAVKAKIAGELQNLAVREGETVRKGQTIGRIDPTEAEARVAERNADLEGARSQLQLAQKNHDTQRALLDRGFISKNAFDGTESTLEVARARVKAAEAALAVTRKALQDTVLTAPMDGIVAQRHAEPGERVPVDGRVVTVADLSRLEMAAPVPAADIAAVRVGQEVTFAVEGYNGRAFAGRVERINPVASSGSRSVDIYLVVENPERTLRGGLFAQGTLILERLPAAVVVPLSALREEAGKRYVYAVDEGRIVRREVALGTTLRDQGLVQVTAGLASGTPVVRSNLGQLREGAAARVAGQPSRS